MKSVRRMTNAARIAAVALCALSSAHMSTQVANAYSFSWVWGDNFDSLSSSKWNVYTGPFGSSNNSYFMPSNAWTSGGRLNLVINQAPNNGGRKYTAGGLDTGWRQYQTYGKWEVRAKFAAGYGITAYIGLYPQDGSWPPEITFPEVLGREYWAGNYAQHWSNGSHQQESFKVWNTQIGSDFNQWHTYAVEWVPGAIYYFVDGRQVGSHTQRFTATPMKLAIGTGTGNCGGWEDCPDNAAGKGWSWPLPATVQVDSVNIFKYNP
jgi:beta-glucanase (GH16 family)